MNNRCYTTIKPIIVFMRTSVFSRKESEDNKDTVILEEGKLVGAKAFHLPLHNHDSRV